MQFQVATPGVYLAMLGIIPWLALTGCREPEKSKAGARSQLASTELQGTEIKAGWGIKRCHIGMSIDECMASLGDPDDRVIDRDEFADGTMSWYDLGLMVAYKDDAIVQVYFHYLSHNYARFPGSLYADLTNSSPKSAVTEKLGKPVEIHTGRISHWQPSDTSLDEKEFFEKHEAGRLRTWYEYPTQGIDVCFVDEDISYVWVYVPRGEQ